MTKALSAKLLTRYNLARSAAIIAALFVFGCKAGPKVEVDNTIENNAEKAEDHYNEGNLDAAEKYYRTTLKRAFAIDDPLESGNASYNLAAVLVSKKNYTLAKSWLTASRVDIRRAGMDESNSWILEAKIARAEERFADVDAALAEVDRLRCLYLETHSCKGAGKKEKDPCDETFCEKLPWIGPRKKCERELNQYDSFIEVQTRLVRAAAALDQGDIATAKCQLEEARARTPETCCGDVMSEVEHVAGRIAMAEGDFRAAGMAFDSEAEILRQMKNYREIPGALDLAAKAYEAGGELEEAAERLVRLARVYYGRDRIREAYDVIVHRALKLAEQTDDAELGARLGLIFVDVEKALRALQQAEAEAAKKAKSKIKTVDGEPSVVVPIDPTPSTLPREGDVIPPTPKEPTPADGLPTEPPTIDPPTP
jgi:tetratricopeptide (TPR) repeat protein